MYGRIKFGFEEVKIEGIDELRMEDGEWRFISFCPL
jgi:hypothetical protein